MSGDHEHDVDFEQYTWHRSQYNRVRPGDLFLYRKKDKNKVLGEFFFYGVGRFRSVDGENEVIAEIDKAHRFDVFVTKTDLENFHWEWKERGDNWGHFFNQYGMDNIPKEDFVRILEKGFDPDRDEDEVPEDTSEFLDQMERGNFFVDDNIGLTKKRRGQREFSNTVKSNYGEKCCICEIGTRAFLIGSHIIPWKDKKEVRLDPANGLCLSSLHDTAFDKGFITVSGDYNVIVSQNIQDQILEYELLSIEGQKIKMPKRQKPKKEYFKYHRDNEFEKFMK